MTIMTRTALLWAGLFTIFTLIGCGEGPDMIVDGGPCQNTPHLCPPDSGTSDGDICVPFGDEADNCDDGIDNDCDGDTDLGDDDCGGSCPGFMVENTMALCTDGIDNDCNGSQDNEMPGMDPNCEPMSCTPGTEPGPDLLENIRPPDECYAGHGWVELVPDGRAWTFKMIMSDPGKTWTCCRVDSPSTCFNTTMGYSDPVNEGYEPSASFDGGPFAIGANRDLVRQVDPENHDRFTFAMDALVNTYVRTSGGTPVTFTCQ